MGVRVRPGSRRLHGLVARDAGPIVRFIEMDEVIEPLEVAPPIRILGMAASPNDLPKLQIDRERQLLTDALEPLRRRGVIELVWVPGRTRQDLNDALLQGPWHVFHFIGHGGYEADPKHEGCHLRRWTTTGLARAASARRTSGCCSERVVRSNLRS